MKILMLNPPFLPKFSRTSRSPAITKGGTIYYPIWLAYATGILEKAGHDVKLIDAPARGYELDHVLDVVKTFDPRLIVMDTSTPSIHNDTKVAEQIKGITDAFLVLVGTHVSALPEETLKMSDKIDAIARHEYDYTLLEIAKVIEQSSSKSLASRLRNVKGISFSYEGRIVHNPDREFITKLDEFPFVSEVYKKHLNIEDYFYAANLHPVITILSGRGCIFRCSFCVWPQVLSGHNYRFRSVKNVVDELEYIKINFPNVKEIFFEDDTLTVDKPRCQELSKEIIRRQLNLTWSCNTRADVDLETLQLMKRSGCRLLCVGFESGSQEILDKIHKGTTLEKIKEFAINAKKAGLMVHGCFILGLPFDTKETVAKTIEFAKELDPTSAQFYPIMVYPGTEAYEWAKKNNYLITDDYSKWLTPEGWHNCMVSRPGLTNDELVKMCDEARIKFYLRPKYLVKSIKLMTTSWSEVKRVFKSGRTFFSYLFKILKGKYESNKSLSDNSCVQR
jgi:radical SAM superfamily enzyme YgiQ (UPF0313 family)